MSRPTNPLALAVLSYLVQRPMHPYELSTTLRDHDDARSIKFNHGSLYMVFKQLDKAGLIRPLAVTREGARPERTTYELTDIGRAELHDWLAELVGEPVFEYPRFVTALSLIGVLPPDEVVELLTDRLAALGRSETEIQGLIDGSGTHPLFTIEEEYRLAQVRTEIAFVEGLIQRITDPERGWAAPWVAFHQGDNP
ncbi:PadR family transcriptional regulator [Actinorhabdospora filicis]|uniref:PadR family transcriptional regulator n=1 Tax=Actinorhabdospora filicis TaxID=1785913 RepID=A0A9W6W6A6_9ACTN|nr:PadR family transcriptional regulator [Actinorhabdospora filicis]GLZ81322.1 PadR family transcriptional regulator [Actinorhabdospora filicis]